MFRFIISAVVLAGCACAQASAIEINPAQPCIRRVCVEMDWAVFNGVRTESCQRWVTEVDARCASAQPFPNGIKLTPPREILLQPKPGGPPIH